MKQKKARWFTFFIKLICDNCGYKEINNYAGQCPRSCGGTMIPVEMNGADELVEI
ncbi:MAG TPA: hypothetical protein VIH90_01040 [Candidatus Saccharimonadales bacterium]